MTEQSISQFLAEFQPSTQALYRAGLWKYYVEYKGLKQQDFDSLIPNPSLDGLEEMKAFVMWAKGRGLAPLSIKSYAKTLLIYWKRNSIRPDKELMTDEVFRPLHAKALTENVPVKMEQLWFIFTSLSWQAKAFFLFLISSGAKYEEILLLNKSDIDFNSNPVELHLREETTKTKKVRQLSSPMRLFKSIGFGRESERQVSIGRCRQGLSLLNIPGIENNGIGRSFLTTSQRLDKETSRELDSSSCSKKVLQLSASRGTPS